MKKKNVLLTQGALIAALYVVLTYCSSVFGLASGAVQIRISEALTILPVLTPAAIPGLFVGCMLSNLLTGSMILDVVFGSFATLLGAIGTYVLRKSRIAYILPPILANALVIPMVLKQVYGLQEATWYLVLTVGAGEVVSVGVLGLLLKKLLWKYRGVLFESYEK